MTNAVGVLLHIIDVLKEQIGALETRAVLAGVERCRPDLSFGQSSPLQIEYA